MTTLVTSFTEERPRIIMAARYACLMLLLAGGARIHAQTTSRVEFHTFTSAALGITKSYNIYLPPGYNSSLARYPVVYFLRGHEREWFNSAEDGSRGGKNLRHVTDSLIAQGQIGPMIVVGPSTASSDIGSTRAPTARTVQCRCGPVTRPVDPTVPTSSPRATRSPSRTRISDRCASREINPRP